VGLKIVRFGELGNCWAPGRFTGGECKRVEECKYPEKKTCKAFLWLSKSKLVTANGHENGIEYNI
jgi:hypothetical protein